MLDGADIAVDIVVITSWSIDRDDLGHRGQMPLADIQVSKALERAELVADQIHSDEDTFGMYFDAARIKDVDEQLRPIRRSLLENRHVRAWELVGREETKRMDTQSL